MKKLLVALMLVLTIPAFAEIEYKAGVYIDQFKIVNDPSSEFNNNLFFFSWKVAEVVRQTSSTDKHTFKESQLCWGDVDEPTCPCDSDGQGGVLSPGVCYLESQMLIPGNITRLNNLTDAREKTIYLAFWHEYKMKGVIRSAIDEMVSEGLNITQKRRALKFVYFGHGIDLAVAQALADDRIVNDIKATYDQYNLATVPLQDRRLLKLFGEVGWFE